MRTRKQFLSKGYTVTLLSSNYDDIAVYLTDNQTGEIAAIKFRNGRAKGILVNSNFKEMLHILRQEDRFGMLQEEISCFVDPNKMRGMILDIESGKMTRLAFCRKYQAYFLP